MSAAVSSKYDALLRTLAEHRRPGELLACLGEAWIKCSCGEKVDLPVKDGMVNQVEALALFDAHVADMLMCLSETPQDLGRCPGSLRPPRPNSVTDTTVGEVGTCTRCGRAAKLRKGAVAPHVRRKNDGGEGLMLLLLLVLTTTGAFVGGYVTCWSSDRTYWRLFKFCPACSRLDCAREHDAAVLPTASEATS